MSADGTCGHGPDFIHHVLAINYLTENAVAPAILAGAVVKKIVIGHIDKKLSRGGVRVGCSGHGDGVAIVFQAIVGFIVDGRADGFLFHARLKAAALHHEARNHAVKNRVVELAGFHVVDKVGNGLRCLLCIQFK